MIVVTGGAGFIGSNLVAALEARGGEEIAIGEIETPARPLPIEEPAVPAKTKSRTKKSPPEASKKIEPAQDNTVREDVVPEIPEEEIRAVEEANNTAEAEEAKEELDIF